MFASTHVLTAGPLPPGPAPTLVAGSVSRVSVMPLTVKVADALAVVFPPLPLEPSAAPHLPPVICAVAPFEFAIDVVTVAPWIGFRPVPSPLSDLTVTVNVWLC